MTKEKKFEKWVHVKITDRELAEQLDAMSESDMRDRSKMVRWLIEQEWKRRNLQAHWVGDAVSPLPIIISTDVLEKAQKPAVRQIAVSETVGETL